MGLGVGPVHAAQKKPSPNMHTPAYLQDTSHCMPLIAASVQCLPVVTRFSQLNIAQLSKVVHSGIALSLTEVNIFNFHQVRLGIHAV